MNIETINEAEINLSDLINRTEKFRERIIINRNGKPAVAIISIEDLEKLEALEDAIDSATLRRAVQENEEFTTLEAVIQSRHDL